MAEWYEGEDRTSFGETAARYAARVILRFKPEAQIERATPAEFDWDLVRLADEAGFRMAPLSEELGGANLDGLGRMVVIERMARGLAGPAALLAAHWAGLSALSGQSRKDVKTWLSELGPNSGERPRLCGLAIPAVVVSETRAEKAALARGPASLKLTGDFICPLHPALCDRVLMVVEGVGDQAALIWECGAELSEHCREIYPGTGLLDLPLSGMELSGLELPAQSLLASGQEASVLAKSLRQELYLGLASAMVGNSASAADDAWNYAKERVQTGRLIIEHQEVRRMLESMKIMVEAARAMVFAAAGLTSEDALERSRRAFTFAGSACETVCLDAIQVLGGYGYMKDYGLERRLRDTKTIQGLFGTYALDFLGA